MIRSCARCMDECPPFEALSYAWGVPIKDQAMICDGKTIRITTNLSEALRQVRLTDKGRTLWVDQVCINQADHEERARQVSLMGQIYQQSERTLICLGQSDHSHAPAVAGLVTAVNGMIDQVFAQDSFTWETNSFPFPQETDKLLTHQGWDSFHRLVQQPWFKRGWVVQEAALAREAFVYWASTVIPWLDILRAYIWYTRRGLKLPHLLKIWLPHLHLQGFNDKRGREAATFHAGTVNRLNILEILDSARWLGVTDPRDRIYAFLSVHKSDQVLPQLPPRYDVPFTDVYRDFALEYLRANRDLDLLHFVDNDDETLREDIASWIPRWNTRLYSSNTGNLNNYHKWSPRILPRVRPIEMRISADGATLQVQAMLLDTVAFAGKAFHKDSTSISDVSSLWKTASKLRVPLVYACDPLDAFLTLFRCGIYRGRLEDWEASQSAYKASLLKDCPESSHASRSAKEFHELRMADLHNKSFFVSTRGYYGLAPKPVVEGDVCCVIFGTRSPFIVRRVAPAGVFKLIGSTLVLNKVLDRNGYPGNLGGDEDDQDWVAWGLKEEVINLA